MNKINRLLFSKWCNKSVSVSSFPELAGNMPDAFYMVNDKSVIIPDVFLAAIVKYYRILSGKEGAVAFSKLSGSDDIEMVVEMPYATETQIAYLKNNKISCLKRVNGNFETFNFKEGHENSVLYLTAFLLSTVVKADAFSFYLANLLNSVYNCLEVGLSSGKIDVDDFYLSVAKIYDRIYQKFVINDTSAISFLTSSGSARKITSIKMQEIENAGYEEYKGKFTFFSGPTVAASKSNTGYDFSLHRALTDDEKKMVPVIDEHYVMPDEVIEVCKLIKETSNNFIPKRNFMFRGPSSTGKTSMAKAIAAKLGLPYAFITCCADTESYDFLGQFIPTTSSDDETKSGFRYEATDFIEGIKNGWVVEVQEPYTIAKQGVLTSLNSLLDDCGGIRLKDGTYIKRHPDAVVIFTTNVSYVGCKKPNQSVLRRMHGVYDILMPSKQTVFDRVKALTNFNNDVLLNKMISTAFKINKELIESCIDDGVCGVTEIVDWVQTYQVLGDVVLAAKSTIVSKATDEIEDQANFITLIEGSFTENDNFSPQENLQNAMNI